MMSIRHWKAEMREVVIAAPGVRDLVGESPVWDPRSGSLYWVDIIGRVIRALDPATGVTRAFKTQDFPTAIGLCQTPGQAVVAFAAGVALVDLDTGAVTPFATLPGEPEGNRLNEGAVGPDGAFWVGTMQTNLNPDGSMRKMDRSSGAFYRVGPDRSVQRVTDPCFGITNTLAWDVARGRMYLGDTLAQSLFATDWPVNDAKPAPLRPHSAVTTDGYPDGSCIDEDGYLWNARYAGRCLLRIAPTGEVASRIAMPAENITACCFGGPDLSTLYVTTAANQLSEDMLSDPFQGALLAVEPGVRGPAPYLFGV